MRLVKNKKFYMPFITFIVFLSVYFISNQYLNNNTITLDTESSEWIEVDNETNKIYLYYSSDITWNVIINSSDILLQNNDGDTVTINGYESTDEITETNLHPKFTPTLIDSYRYHKDSLKEIGYFQCDSYCRFSILNVNDNETYSIDTYLSTKDSGIVNSVYEIEQLSKYLMFIGPFFSFLLIPNPKLHFQKIVMDRKKNYDTITITSN